MRVEKLSYKSPTISFILRLLNGLIEVRCLRILRNTYQVNSNDMLDNKACVLKILNLNTADRSLNYFRAMQLCIR